MTRTWIIVALSAIAMAAGMGSAFAQSNFPSSSQYGSSTNSGLFGSRSVGSTVTAGNRTTTGSSASGGLGSNNQSTAGQLDANARYVRGNRQGAFVGADTSDASNPYSQQGQQLGRNQMQQGQLQQMLGMNRNQQAQMLNQQLQQNGQNGKQNREIRAMLKVDFETPALAPDRVAERAQAVVVRAKPLQGLGTIQVGVEHRIAVLRGTVHSERARKLAEQLVLLEPGISDVRNELQVTPPPSPPGR